MAPLLLSCAVAALGREPRTKIQPEDPPPWQVHPMDVRVDVVRTLIEQHDPGRALELIAAFKQEGIESPEITLLQGIALRDTGMPDLAERLLIEAKSQLGRDARPSAELCVLYADAHRVEDAVDACDRAVSIDRENPRSWNNYGWMLLAAKRPEEAATAFESAIHLDGSQERYRNNLAFAQVALDKLPEAERTFRLAGSRADAAYNVGVALEQAGRPADALTWYRSALAYDPTHERARDALAAADADPPEEINSEESP
jgi:Flp pilus assembly protein TadD